MQIIKGNFMYTNSPIKESLMIGRDKEVPLRGH